MPKKPKITDDEIELFRNAVSGTKPLLQKKLRISFNVKSQHKRTETIPQQVELSDPEEINFVRSEEFIAFKHHSISNKTLRKLRKGQYNVEAKLDLHGMTTEEAKKEVQKFLQQALNYGQRVVLIIHGKGRHTDMPILKSKINAWLRQLSIVLAFCSAHSSHGSRGAIYVLLKRASQEEEV